MTFHIDVESNRFHDHHSLEMPRKKGTSMILCFYRQEVETFKEKHKIIDVPYSLQIIVFCSEANDFDSGKILTNASIVNN